MFLAMIIQLLQLHRQLLVFSFLSAILKFLFSELFYVKREYEERNCVAALASLCHLYMPCSQKPTYH
jgi:hypothetical protein